MNREAARNNQIGRPNNRYNTHSHSSFDELNIEGVIGYYEYNKKDKDVKAKTKELLLNYLDKKYSNYETNKKKKK